MVALALRRRRHPGSADALGNGADVAHRANLDATQLRPGKFHGDPNGLVHVVSLDEIEPAEHFFGLGEWTVDRRRLAIADANRLCGGGRLELLRVDEISLAFELLGVLDAPFHRLVELPLRDGG